jgi:hypothetical protein
VLSVVFCVLSGRPRPWDAVGSNRATGRGVSRPDAKTPGRVAPASDAAVEVQLSKSNAGLRDLSNPAQTGRGNAGRDKIFLLFPLPVKMTRRGDNQA